MTSECDTLNKFMVGISGARITFLRPVPHTISMDDALNLAAWLVALADGRDKFPAVLEAVQST